MARIEGIRIRNFRTLKDVTLGKLWNTQKVKPLTPMTSVIGKNGVGKSTLFDAFGFLADCLRVGVEDACDLRGRGGFDRIRSMGADGPIEFEIYYRETSKSRPITYELSISKDLTNRPFVHKERLRQRREGQTNGRPFSFLMVENGYGAAWAGHLAGLQEEIDSIFQDIIKGLNNEKTDEESNITEIVQLEDPRKLGIATLGSLKQHPRISAFRSFIESWYLSYFSPDAARSFTTCRTAKTPECSWRQSW